MRTPTPISHRTRRARAAAAVAIALPGFALLGLALFGDAALRTARADEPSAASANAAGVPDDAHDCLVEPHVTADVGSPAQGIVARLLVERGETVVRGQPIAELEAGVERAMLDQAEARADMRSEVASREADLALARLDKKRFSDLHARRLAPEQQRDEASARHQVASAALVQALENRKLDHLELQRARRLLEQRTVRSPIDGVVVRRHLHPGELVHDEPLMTIAGLDPLRVEVVLPARLFGTVRRGDPARLFLELGDGASLSARVEIVDPLLDTRSGTFGVRLRLPNPERAIAAGQKCRVAFEPGAIAETGSAEAPIAAARPVPGADRPLTSDSADDDLSRAGR